MEFDAQRFWIIALSVARIAFDPDIWKEVHLHSELSVAITVVAATASGIEAKAPCGIASHLGLGKLGEEGANQIK